MIPSVRATGAKTGYDSKQRPKSSVTDVGAREQRLYVALLTAVIGGTPSDVGYIARRRGVAVSSLQRVSSSQAGLVLWTMVLGD